MPLSEAQSNIPEPAEEPHRLERIMIRELITVDMDATLGKAIAVCAKGRIRHLPVVDEQGCLVGLVTDRDLRYFAGPRLGTISENNSDRESLGRHLHIFMVRRVVTGSPEMPLDVAARLMLTNRVGCLPVVDEDRHLVGIVTTSDFLRYVAGYAE